MSWGIAICSKCRREVHQDGPNQTWTHCEDKSPRCERANSAYPKEGEKPVGRVCGADDMPALRNL